MQLCFETTSLSHGCSDKAIEKQLTVLQGFYKAQVKSLRAQNFFSGESAHWVKKRNLLTHARQNRNNSLSDRPQSFIYRTRSGSNFNPKFTEWKPYTPPLDSGDGTLHWPLHVILIFSSELLRELR